MRVEAGHAQAAGQRISLSRKMRAAMGPHVAAVEALSR